MWHHPLPQSTSVPCQRYYLLEYLKKGHFQTVCKGDTRVRGVHQEETPPPIDGSTDTLLGTVGENPWVVNLRLNGQSETFCNNTRAEVTVIPEQVYQQLPSPPLLSSHSLVPRPHPLSRGEGSGTLQAIFGA